MYANERNSVLFATHSMNCVLRVYSDGNIEKVLYLEGPSRYGGSIYYGSDAPLISPDQRHVAVIRKNDLWIFEPDAKILSRITQVARPYTEKYLSVEVKTVSWSWDSRKLIYSVSSGDPGSGDDGFDRKERPAKYGFYIYDIKDKSTIFTPHLKGGGLKAWLPDGDILHVGTCKTVKGYEECIMKSDLIEDKLIPFPVDRKMGQIDISRDGKWLVARTDEPKEAFNKDPRSQIVKIDLNNYDVIPLTPVGKWTEYQWPRLSPSGKHVLYEWLIKDGNPRIVSIAVNGKKIYTAPWINNCSWINDNTIAFTSSINPTEYNKREIVIIDSATGEIKGRHKID
jgi:Tol biopolymer transport system component